MRNRHIQVILKWVIGDSTSHSIYPRRLIFPRKSRSPTISPNLPNLTPKHGTTNRGKRDNRPPRDDGWPPLTAVVRVFVVFLHDPGSLMRAEQNIYLVRVVHSGNDLPDALLWKRTNRPPGRGQCNTQRLADPKRALAYSSVSSCVPSLQIRLWTPSGGYDREFFPPVGGGYWSELDNACRSGWAILF